MVLACRRTRSPPLLRRGRQVHGRAASRDRHRARRRSRGSSSGERRGDVRRHGADTRADRHHHDVRRAPGFAHPPRPAGREEGRSCLRGRCRLGAWSFGRARARGSVRPPRCPSRRGHVRRSALSASVAGYDEPSPGSRGAARTSSVAEHAASTRGRDLLGCPRSCPRSCSCSCGGGTLRRAERRARRGGDAPRARLDGAGLRR
jgi:hypothetical protein